MAPLVAGEGYRNNHHAFPGSAKFSYRSSELDLGFGACVLLEKVGLLAIDHEALIPAEAAAPVTSLSSS